MADYAERIFKDTPIDLSARDFTVSYEDPRWYHDGGVEELAQHEGIAKSNAALINHLNKKLGH